MPAMSRQMLSGTSRSAIVLAGSPSKSMIFQPLGVCSVWPRWKSPCTRCVSRVRSSQRGEASGAVRRRGGPGPARSRPPGRAARTWSPTPWPRAPGPWGTPPAARRGSRPAPAPALRPRRRSRGPRAAGRAPDPSRRWPRDSFSTAMARSAASSAPPPTQVASIQPYRPATLSMPARVERVVHLDVEIAPQFEPAEELHHRDVAEHHRGVALLAAEDRAARGRSSVPHRRRDGSSPVSSGPRTWRPASSAFSNTRQACGSWAAS